MFIEKGRKSQRIVTLALTVMMFFSGCMRSRPKEKYPGGLIKTTLGMFEVDCGRYPTTSEGLDALLKLPNNTSITNWHGPYLEKASDLEDQWGHKFGYRCPGNRNPNGYDLYSAGPDGKEGTADDIGNWIITPSK